MTWGIPFALYVERRTAMLNQVAHLVLVAYFDLRLPPTCLLGSHLRPEVTPGMTSTRWWVQMSSGPRRKRVSYIHCLGLFNFTECRGALKLSISLVLSVDNGVITGVYFTYTLQWRQNEPDGVSNHRCLDCLLNRFWPVDSPHKGPVTRIMFPFDDVIMIFSPM